jgi:hypothetical protein
MQLVFFEFFICSIIFLDFGVSGESFSLYSVGKTPIDLLLLLYLWCVHNRLFNANFEEKFK